MKKSTKNNLPIYVGMGVIAIIILIILVIIFRHDIWNWIGNRSDQDVEQWKDIIKGQ